MELLEKLSGIEAVENIREQLFDVKKIQLHTGLEGYKSPSAYGIYKNTGGNALGVVGSTFEPVNLNLLLDAILENAMCCETLQIDKIKFRELYGGSKVDFIIPAQDFEVKSPMVGDVLKTQLVIRTGFDGKTKTAMNFETYRLWCKNGCGSWHNDVNVAVKNTSGNNLKGKTYAMADQMVKVLTNVGEYKDKLNEAVNKKVTQKQIDDLMLRLVGKTGEDYADLSSRARNTIDRINESVAIEMMNTGDNMYSLLQGVTRYVSHDVLEGDLSTITFATAGKLNKIAHDFAFSN